MDCSSLKWFNQVGAISPVRTVWERALPGGLHRQGWQFTREMTTLSSQRETIIVSVQPSAISFQLFSAGIWLAIPGTQSVLREISMLLV
jgi:hypothetical protein